MDVGEKPSFRYSPDASLPCPEGTKDLGHRLPLPPGWLERSCPLLLLHYHQGDIIIHLMSPNVRRTSATTASLITSAGCASTGPLPRITAPVHTASRHVFRFGNAIRIQHHPIPWR